MEEEPPVRSHWQYLYEQLRDEYETLPKLEGWVAWDLEGELSLYKDLPRRDGNGGWTGHFISRLDEYLYPDLSWEDEPKKVELLIKTN